MSFRAEPATASTSESLQARERREKGLGNIGGIDLAVQRATKVQSTRGRNIPILWGTRPRVIQYVDLQGWATYTAL